MKMRMQKVLQTLILAVSVILMTSTFSLAEVTFDQTAIEAEIAAAIAAGVEPELAAKQAIANAVLAIKEANPDYVGGEDALNTDIFNALASLNIAGLDDTTAILAANHALGNSVDPALEASGQGKGQGQGQQNQGGLRGRENAQNQGGNAYGPSGKPKPGSPT